MTADALLEVAAGVNRGAIQLADIPADIANAVLQLSGSDTRVPKLANQPIVQQGIQGGPADGTVNSDIVFTG